MKVLIPCPIRFPSHVCRQPRRFVADALQDRVDICLPFFYNLTMSSVFLEVEREEEN
jgi:hypothetical protein